MVEIDERDADDMEDMTDRNGDNHQDNENNESSSEQATKKGDATTVFKSAKDAITLRSIDNF